VTVVSVQSFGIAAPGGGPRILRALFENEPVVNVCTSVSPPSAADPFSEVWLPARPGFGRIERTRVGGPLGTLESALARRLEGQIAATCEEHGATAVHAVAHSSDFWPALRASRRLGLPFMLTVHDDIRYVLRSRPDRALAQRRLGEAWREASHRFVIGTKIAEEYCSRYGRRPYTVVTDGLRDDQIAARPTPAAGLRAYFAGLFHRAYIGNVPAFAEGLASLGRSSFTLRCGTLPVELDAAALGATVLPFGPEDVVDSDLREADIVYMPLPFGTEYRDFFRFSLSTKMVTYLGSGRPIVYHGPRDGTAYELLADHDAAIVVDTLEPAAIARALAEGLERSDEIAANALALARTQFRLADQRARFWNPFPGAARLAA
jgi:glycosyltransferase involved in cell wall biosynthesis